MPSLAHQARIKRQLTEQRLQVLYTADCLNLAIYHKRPAQEIKRLTSTLASLTGAQKSIMS